MSIIIDSLLIPMAIVTLIFAGLILTLVVIPYQTARTVIMWRRGDLAYQRDLRFSNTVYLCDNDKCDRKFFRMYQIFDAYNRRDMFIPGEQNVNEKSYAQNVHVKWVEELGICRCPDCHEATITQAKQFDWMDKNPAFPKLNSWQLAKRRLLFKNADNEKKTNRSLKTIRQKINGLDSIAAYQHQYTLSDPTLVDVDTRIQSIRDQLKLLQANTQHQSSQKLVAELMGLLGAHGTQRFSAKPPTPIRVPLDDHTNRLKQTLESIKATQRSLRVTAFTTRDKNRRNDERYTDIKRKTYNLCHKYNRLRQAHPETNGQRTRIIERNGEIVELDAQSWLDLYKTKG